MSDKLAMLVVDDHRDTAEVLARLLAFDGHHAVTAASCAQALRLAAAEAFDLYLLDIQLPDGDGCDLLRQIQAIHPAPALAISGCGMADDQARAREAGFAEYLVKPFALGDVRRAVERVQAHAMATAPAR